jgi:hypothetical protein
VTLTFEEEFARLSTPDNLPVNPATYLYSYDPQEYDRLIQLPDFRLMYAPPHFAEGPASLRLAALKSEISRSGLNVQPDSPERRAELSRIAESLNETQRRLITEFTES